MKKKKKQGSSDAAGEAGAGISVSGDIKSMIHEHSMFFDRLVELIPAKFYLPADDQEKVWFQGLSKAAKAKAKKDTIENIKKSRRDRLDPEKSSKTTLDLLKESVEKVKSENGPLGSNDEEAGGSAEPAKVTGADGDGRSVTYEELRQRLRRKIEELRAGRGGSEKDEERSDKKEERKRKREDWMKKKEENNVEKEKRKKKEREVENKVLMAAEGIEFGKVKLGDDNLETDRTAKNKKRKLSKEEELERAQKLQEAKKDPEKGKAVAEKHSWQAAESRAMGVKVHDNPRLLKESLQREKRMRKKSAEKWQERAKTTQSMKKEKQDKRKGNIQAKIEKKKMKKIERREKKLMKKRPGFEGRKDGYINGG